MRASMRWVACLGLVVVAGGLVAVSAEAERDRPRARCDLGTLKGFYLFSADGVIDGEPVAQAGYENYYGNGHMDGLYTTSENGVITRFIKYTGSYTVDEDCRGTLTTTETREGGEVIVSEYDHFIDPSGDKFSWISTDEGSLLAGMEIRSSKSTHR